MPSSPTTVSQLWESGNELEWGMFFALKIDYITSLDLLIIFKNNLYKASNNVFPSTVQLFKEKGKPELIRALQAYKQTCYTSHAHIL